MDDTFGASIGRLFCAAIPLAVALSSTTAASAASDPAAAAGDAHRPGETPHPERASDDGGLLGPVRLGVLTGVSVPRPVSVEALLKVHDVVGLGVEYSVLPPIDVSGVHASLYAIDADVRVFVTRSGFFVGVNGGKQHFDAAGTFVLPMGLGSVQEQISADTWFVGARVGFLRTWKSGFSLGMDAGAQIPVSAKFTNSVPGETGMSQTATDVAHLIGKSVLPNVNLVRIGYLF